MKRLEAKHGPRDALNEAMILLDLVVELLSSDNFDGPPSILEFENDVQLLEACEIGPAFIDGNPGRNAVGKNSAFEEASCRRGIAPLGQHDFKGLVVTIYGPVVTHPLAAHLDIGLVHPPRDGSRPLVRPGHLP